MCSLSHDELGVVVDGLADPLEPVVAVAFSSTCKGLRTPLRATLEVLKERHEKAAALCRGPFSCAQLRETFELDVDEWPEWPEFCLSYTDIATLGMLLSKWLPKLGCLNLQEHDIGDSGMQVLCESLGHGAAPGLIWLNLGWGENGFGPAGAEALAAALRRGAMPNLATLLLAGNKVGKDGAAALAAPLRALPELYNLNMDNCDIGDDGVASLLADLGKDEFKELKWLGLDENNLTDKSFATVTAAICRGALPSLRHMSNNFREVEDQLQARQNLASEAASS